jgi:hypothetical protein
MFQNMSYTLEEFGAIVLSVLNKYYLTVFKRYKGMSWGEGGDCRLGREDGGDEG